MSASSSIVLDTRRIKRSGTYPVKLLVVFNSQAKRYQTLFDLTQQDFDNLWGASRVSDKNRIVREELKELQRRSEDQIKSQQPFSFKEFEREFVLGNPSLRQRKHLRPKQAPMVVECDLETYREKFPIFKNPTPEPGTILSVFLRYIDRLLKEHRIATATHYQTAYNTFAKYWGNPLFTDIDSATLKGFEHKMLENGYSITTIGIYTRCLRAMFNEADYLGIIKKGRHYPFGRRKYVVPASRNIKKALSINDVEKIYNYVPACHQEKWAKDMWLFSYFGNGINTKDILHLKWKNIDEDFLVFVRAKTEASTRQAIVPISVFINKEMWRIIHEWGTADRHPENFIFPGLKKEMSALEQYQQLGLFVRSINDWMAKVRKKLAIEKAVTTYVARHTFSTILKKAGVSTEYISEALGHKSLQTTKHYLDSFERDIKRQYADKLLAFQSKSS